MKIITYNVNGIRSAMDKGLVSWLKSELPDILHIQETKAQDGQIDLAPFEALGYTMYHHQAQKKGYSGVATFTRLKPENVVRGMGVAQHDNEGRVLRLDFGDITVINAYFPSGSTGDVRQEVKMQFLSDFEKFIAQLRQQRPNIIVSGDFNVCHLWIDIHNPDQQQQSSGFLPEERAWMEQWKASGFTDCFRFFNNEPHHYSWWSFRAGSRQRNKGWRIDYNWATNTLQNRLQAAGIMPQVAFSDHCPVWVTLQ